MQLKTFQPGQSFEQHLMDQFKAMNESNSAESRATKLHNSLLESRTLLSVMSLDLISCSEQ